MDISPGAAPSSPIPLFKPYVSKRCLADLKQVLYSGYLGEGPKVKEFERVLSEYFDGYVVLVNSGTSALHLALHLAGVRDRDVISTPMTCLATNTPVLHNGGRVIWADVDPDTGNIDPASVSARITGETRAVMVVHYGGNLCDPALTGLCDGRGIQLIEDCAHLAGPGLGGLQCYSFQAIKYLTTGDGGCLVTKDRGIYERAKLLRWYGIDRDSGQTLRGMDPVHEAGYKFHMNDIAATIGLANFVAVPSLLAKVGRHAARYHAAFRSLKHVRPVPVPHRHDYYLYILLAQERDRFATYMRDRGIETSSVHVRNDIQPIFARSRCPLPGLENFWSRQICIPVGWWLSAKQTKYIADTVRSFDALCSG